MQWLGTIGLSFFAGTRLLFGFKGTPKGEPHFWCTPKSGMGQGRVVETRISIPLIPSNEHPAELQRGYCSFRARFAPLCFHLAAVPWCFNFDPYPFALACFRFPGQQKEDGLLWVCSWRSKEKLEEMIAEAPIMLLL